VNFQNKTNKIGTKSEGKKSLRATVIFFIGNAQIEVNKREMKGKKIKPASNKTQSPYIHCLGRKRASRCIK
jgi:hypothetical protein